MEAVRQLVDEAVRLVAARGTGRLAVHYVHERYDDGACEPELVAADDPDVLPVSTFVIVESEFRR